MRCPCQSHSTSFNAPPIPPGLPRVRLTRRGCEIKSSAVVHVVAPQLFDGWHGLDADGALAISVDR